LLDKHLQPVKILTVGKPDCKEFKMKKNVLEFCILLRGSKYIAVEKSAYENKFKGDKYTFSNLRVIKSTEEDARNYAKMLNFNLTTAEG
jgi:hypothetical protein